MTLDRATGGFWSIRQAASGSVPGTSSGPPRAGRRTDGQSPSGRAALLPDDRDRAARRRTLGLVGLRRPGGLRRPPPPHHLRAAHGGRPHRLRRARRALPLGARVRAGFDHGDTRVRRAARDAARAVPRARRSRPSPTSGAAPSASPATGPAPSGLDRRAGLGLGRRLRRRRRGHQQPGRADPRRPHPGRDTELTRLPWVGHRSRRWEPEPLRWLGINAGLRLPWLADREEDPTGRRAARRPAQPAHRALGFPLVREIETIRALHTALASGGRCEACGCRTSTSPVTRPSCSRVPTSRGWWSSAADSHGTSSAPPGARRPGLPHRPAGARQPLPRDALPTERAVRRARGAGLRADPRCRGVPLVPRRPRPPRRLRHPAAGDPRRLRQPTP